LVTNRSIEIQVKIAYGITAAKGKPWKGVKREPDRE
jgi:hypothetical protein